MHSSDPEFTDPAMAVIKRIDPDTYAKIAADDGWDVSTDDEPGQEGASGITAKYNLSGELASRDERYSVLDPEVIRRDAAYLGVPVADNAAAVLVHEFYHHRTGKGEVPAYTASVRFDLMLPPRDRALLQSDYEALRNEQNEI